jgi:hypothetical protein
MIINEALVVFHVVVFYNFFESLCKIINTWIQIICSTVEFLTSQNKYVTHAISGAKFVGNRIKVLDLSFGLNIIEISSLIFVFCQIYWKII